MTNPKLFADVGQRYLTTDVLVEHFIGDQDSVVNFGVSCEPTISYSSEFIFIHRQDWEFPPTHACISEKVLTTSGSPENVNISSGVCFTQSTRSTGPNISSRPGGAQDVVATGRVDPNPFAQEPCGRAFLLFPSIPIHLEPVERPPTCGLTRSLRPDSPAT